MKRILHSRAISRQEYRRRVFRPSDSGACTIECASCGAETDITRGMDGRIETTEFQRLDVPLDDFRFDAPDTLTQRTETRMLRRNVRGWICSDCVVQFGAVSVVTQRPKPPVWRIGPSVFHNTPVQRKAAEKLQNYLDYCDLSGEQPSPDMVWAITAVHKARRSYGFTKVTEIQRASAGWAHTGKPWPSWDDITLAKAVDVLDSKKTRGRASRTSYRPADYIRPKRLTVGFSGYNRVETVNLSRIVDAALQDARRTHTDGLGRTIVDNRRVYPYESGQTWQCHALQGEAFTDHPFSVAGLVADLPPILDAAIASARIEPPKTKPTFGESSRVAQSGAVCMEYRPTETPQYQPTIGQRIACKHGLLPQTCVWCNH